MCVHFILKPPHDLSHGCHVTSKLNWISLWSTQPYNHDHLWKQFSNIWSEWLIIIFSNMASFFRFVDKQVFYRWYNLIHTCASECDSLFYWQHKLCATFSANVNINYCLPIKVYYRICTLGHIRIEINHGSQNVFWDLTWVVGY